jgi:succinate dehydrogenase / fumarate reductase cytochrome b subunit
VESAATVAVTASRPSFVARHQFLIYRLFSLLGIFFGGYVVVHLLTNASVLAGVATFQESVDRIHSLGPALPAVEWTFLFIPILFHMAVGWAIIAGAVPNLGIYRTSSNARYVLQRVTAIILFFFIVGHVLHMHHYGAAFGGGRFVAENAASSAGEAIQQALWIQLFYALGVLSAAFHLGNGIWTFGITWGLWTTPTAQRRANYVAGAIGIFVAVVGIASIVGFRQVNVEQAQVIEQRMEQARKMLYGEAP